MIAAHVGLWSLPGVAFGVTTVVSGNPLLGAGAAVVGAALAKVLLPRAVAALTDDHVVSAGEHAVDGTIDAIEVFWRPGCPFVDGLGRHLADAGVPTNLRNIWENPDDAAIVRSLAAGKESVPTLVIGPVALVNPSAELVMATLQAHAPHLLEARR